MYIRTNKGSIYKSPFVVVVCYFISGTQRCATPTRSLDENCSARRPYLCARRARMRRSHTHATCERRNDANASSEEAMVDVEVDRCIDENSAANLNYRHSFIEAPSIKYTAEPGRQPPNGRRPSPPTARELTAAIRANRTFPRHDAQAVRLENEN